MMSDADLAWRHDFERHDVLKVEPLPDAALVNTGREAEHPAQSHTLRHPELIQLAQILPVPAHLENAYRNNNTTSVNTLNYYFVLDMNF